MTDDDKLARMANQIAAFFRAYPEAEAVAGVHDHIRAFWAPKMRAALAERAAADAAGLDPLVVEALRLLAAPAPAPSPAAKETAGPEEVGAIDSSDAG